MKSPFYFGTFALLVTEVSASEQFTNDYNSKQFVEMSVEDVNPQITRIKMKNKKKFEVISVVLKEVIEKNMEQEKRNLERSIELKKLKEDMEEEKKQDRTFYKLLDENLFNDNVGTISKTTKDVIQLAQKDAGDLHRAARNNAYRKADKKNFEEQKGGLSRR